MSDIVVLNDVELMFNEVVQYDDGGLAVCTDQDGDRWVLFCVGDLADDELAVFLGQVQEATYK